MRGRWGDGGGGSIGLSAKLVVVGFHQGLLLFLVVTRLITGAVAALGFLTRFTLCRLLMQILVDELQRAVRLGW